LTIYFSTFVLYRFHFATKVKQKHLENMILPVHVLMGSSYRK